MNTVVLEIPLLTFKTDEIPRENKEVTFAVEVPQRSEPSRNSERKCFAMKTRATKNS